MNQLGIPSSQIRNQIVCLSVMKLCAAVKLHACYYCNFAVYFALVGSCGLALTTNSKFINFQLCSQVTKNSEKYIKFKLIIAAIEKNSYLIIYSKQLVSEFFKSVALFFGHPVQDILSPRMLVGSFIKLIQVINFYYFVQCHALTAFCILSPPL